MSNYKFETLQLHVGQEKADPVTDARACLLYTSRTWMMNNTRPSFYLISSAVDGNVNSIEKILAFYDPYISKCCLRPFYDRYGNVCIVVDMELKGRIREALIKMILDFDIPLETEE